MSSKEILELVCIIAITLILISVTMTVGICYHSKTMVENGYEEVILPGRQSSFWQKSK
jgi:hypothetical protein